MFKWVVILSLESCFHPGGPVMPVSNWNILVGTEHFVSDSVQTLGHAAAAARWKKLCGVGPVIVQLRIIEALAWLLPHVGYTLQAAMTVMIGLAHSSTDAHLTNAIIYQQDVTRGEFSTTYWANLASGLLVRKLE